MDPLQTVKSPVSGVEPGPALAARAGRTGSWTGSGVVALGEGDGGVASVRVAEPAGILDSWGSGPGPDTWAPVRAVLTTLAPLLRPAARGERPIEEALAPAGPPASTSSSEEPAAEAGDRVHRPAPSGPVPAAAAGTATPVRPAQGAEGEPPAPPDSPMGRDGTLGPEPAAPAGEAPETAGVEGREPAARATGFGLSVGERARAPATPVAASMAPVHAAASGNDELSLMLPRHLRLEVADAGGSWTLEIHDHGRALDVLVRGHGSMGAIVAAAAPELRTALAQDGHTLGLLDFVAADGGDPRERAGRQEQGEPGEGRASPRETTPGGPAPGARTFRPGRIHRVA
jgi:hypothetical protein